MPHRIVLVRRDIGYLILHSLKEWNVDKIHGNIKKKFVLTRKFCSKQGNFWEIQLDEGGSTVFKLLIVFITKWLTKTSTGLPKDLREFNTGFWDIA